MGKEKLHKNPSNKRTVSTAAMFKNTGIEMPQRVKISRRLAKPYLPAKTKSTRNSKLHGIYEISDHPILAEFSNAVDNSRACIREAMDAEIEAAYIELEKSLIYSNERLQRLYDEIGGALDKLKMRFQDQEIEWNSKDGKHTSGITSLDYRMRKLRKVMEMEEKNVSTAWKEWDDLQSEILAPSKGLGDKLEATEALRYQDFGGFRSELNAEKNKYLEQVKALQEKSSRAMEESEKRIQLKSQLAEKTFLAMLTDE